MFEVYFSSKELVILRSVLQFAGWTFSSFLLRQVVIEPSCVCVYDILKCSFTA